ncbi:MAG: Type I restriction-modification system specificity subunit S [uncultured bacterium]|nr:MAG: Type I restriction-modification system specificity subunit S [uncultured bacterium]
MIEKQLLMNYQKMKMIKIPNGWKQATLKEIGHFSKGSGISKAELVETGINAIRYGELYTRHHFKVKKIHSFIPEISTKTSKKIKYGDIIFAGSGETIDEIGKSATYLSHDDCYAGGDTIIFSPKNANSLFLTYTLNIGNARKKLRRLGQGQSVVHLYKSDLENLSISLPPLPEQGKIVEVLETWDECLEKLEKVIKSKKKIKKGLMQQLLTGKKRLSGFIGEWKNVKLGDVTKRVRRKNSENNRNVLTISAQMGLVSQEEYFDKQIASDNLGNYLLLYKNDFAYNKSYSRGYPMGAMKRLKLYEKGVVSSLYFSFIATNINPDYLEHYFDAGFFNQEIGKTAQEGARNHGLLNIGYDDFMDGDIHIPTNEEQTAIANILTTADQEIEALEKKRALIEDQKKFLLNNLVTGKIRLPEFINAN